MSSYFENVISLFIEGSDNSLIPFLFVFQRKIFFEITGFFTKLELGLISSIRILFIENFC